MTTNEFKHKILPLSLRIFPLAARMLKNDEEAEDAVQDIMIKLWNIRKQLNKHPNVPGFVFLTTRNYCLDQLKKKKIKQEAILNPRLIADLYINQDQIEFEDVLKLVHQILNELPQNQKEVLLMRDIDGLEFDEIVAITNLKIEHIRVLLSRARKHLRVQLKKTYHYEEGIYS